MTQRFDDRIHIQPNKGDVERVDALLPLLQRTDPGLNKSDVWRKALRIGFDALIEKHAINGSGDE